MGAMLRSVVRPVSESRAYYATSPNLSRRKEMYLFLAQVDAYRAELDRIAALVTAGDGAALQAVFERASAARREWGARFAKGTGTGVAAEGPREP